MQNASSTTVSDAPFLPSPAEKTWVEKSTSLYFFREKILADFRADSGLQRFPGLVFRLGQDQSDDRTGPIPTLDVDVAGLRCEDERDLADMPAFLSESHREEISMSTR